MKLSQEGMTVLGLVCFFFFQNVTFSLQLEVSPYFSASVIMTRLPQCQIQPASCSDPSLSTEPAEVLRSSL